MNIERNVRDVQNVNDNEVFYMSNHEQVMASLAPARRILFDALPPS